MSGPCDHTPFAEVATVSVPIGMDRLETTLRATEAQIEAGGWDQPNRLMQLRGHGCGCTGVVDLPDLAANVGHYYPPAVLGGMARALATTSAPPPGPPGSVFEGWLFAVETWSATADPADGRALASLEADANARRIHERADRGEARLTMLGTVHGARLMLIRTRGHLFPRLHHTLNPSGLGTVDPVSQAFEHLVRVSSALAGGGHG